MSKEKLREEIARQTEEFLARGGVIEVIPSIPVCPPNMEWARNRGMDYTPWNHYGDPFALSKDGWERLGDSNYWRPARPTED